MYDTWSGQLAAPPWRRRTAASRSLATRASTWGAPRVATGAAPAEVDCCALEDRFGLAAAATMRPGNLILCCGPGIVSSAQLPSCHLRSQATWASWAEAYVVAAWGQKLAAAIILVANK